MSCTPLPAASLIACLAASSRSLSCSLWAKHQEQCQRGLTHWPGWQAHLTLFRAGLTEMYSARALAVSGPTPSPDRSHDSILSPLFSQRALKSAVQPSSPSLLPRRLWRGHRKCSWGPDTLGAWGAWLRLAAHPSSDSLVSLSTAAIALAPSTPIRLSSSLPASAEGAACQKCSWGCDAYRPSVDLG